ncbi:MAG: branched-chain amino acid transaminase [archaeon]
MEPTEFIWFNGSFVKWRDAKIHVLSHCLHYGSGAFEGIRCYKTQGGTAIFRLKDHVKRILDSFAIFGVEIKYSEEQICKAVIETVKTNWLEEGYIRPILFFGYGEMGLKNLNKCEVNLVIACWPGGSYLGGKAVSAKISSIRRISPKSFSTSSKICGHYVNSILASKEASKEGYNETIMLDDREKVAGGPGENIFIIKNEKIRTPKLGSILPGITRDSIMQIAKDLGYNVLEKGITQKELFSADECFFSGTAAEVTAIKRINKKKIGKGEEGPITSKIKQVYLDAVRGKIKKYQSWLTYAK